LKLLTVAVPVYNMESLLPRCLGSFANADFAGRLEVLVINDGSTDGSEKVARGFVRRMPTLFTLISQKNAGHGGAVNTAMAQATGKYFRIVDADDWVNAASLPALLTVMEQTDADLLVDEKTEVGIVSGARNFFPLPRNLLCGKILPFPASFTPVLSDYFMLHNVSVRTSLLRSGGIRLLEHTYYVDYEFILAVTALARSIVFCRLPIYNYSVGSIHQSVSLTNYVRHYDDHLRVVKRCIELMDSHRTDANWNYLFLRVRLLLNTHLNICLLYDADRKRGRDRALALRRTLRDKAPALNKATRKRYAAALALNLLGARHGRKTKGA
jgi:glycosyltransferase involved in cell wall biosynthesis